MKLHCGKTHLSTGLVVTLFLLSLSITSALLAEIRFVPLPDPSESDIHPSSAGVRSLSEALDGPGNVLLLPYFEVDGTQDSMTTFLGLRNVSLISDTSVDITYFDVNGNTTAVEAGVVLPASGVVNRNLRLVPGLPSDGDGFKRGFATVVGNTSFSGEYFQMDPDNAFATGSRLIANGELCFVGDARFIQGGPFTGGTQFRLFINIPLGVQPNDPPSASFTVANEAGTIFGTVGIQTDQVVNEFSIGDLTNALPGSIGPSFGSVLVVFSAPGYGLLEASYSALGLYSVGVAASCQTLAP